MSTYLAGAWWVKKDLIETENKMLLLQEQHLNGTLENVAKIRQNMALMQNHILRNEKNLLDLMLQQNETLKQVLKLSERTKLLLVREVSKQRRYYVSGNYYNFLSVVNLANEEGERTVSSYLERSKFQRSDK